MLIFSRPWVVEVFLMEYMNGTYLSQLYILFLFHVIWAGVGFFYIKKTKLAHAERNMN